MAKEIDEQPHAMADTLLGRTKDDGELVLDELRVSEDSLRAVDKIVIVACGTAVVRRDGREVRHRALDPDPVRGRACP
jgi:glucosamine 6-phosphate synthetase-like amidotransferase/phosphosugar isomerase protein